MWNSRIEDITAFVALVAASRLEWTVPEACAAVRRWQAEIRTRPSAAKVLVATRHSVARDKNVLLRKAGDIHIARKMLGL